MDETNDTQDVALENNEEQDTEETKDTQKEPDSRLKELEAELAKYKRIAKREANKAAKEEAPTKETKSSDLDYGQKAYLRSYDIKGSDELELVRNWMERTGDTLDALVEDDLFTAKLTKLREARAAADAIPKGTRRIAAPATDDVSYWAGKISSGQIQLNDIPDLAIRRKVLNARIEQERTGSRFSDNPISMG